jgi:hypothetical protein
MYFKISKVLVWTLLLLGVVSLKAQDYEPGDSLHFPVDKGLPPKVLHAEPLYIDLIRDLGARKGEKEWNVGLAMVDQVRFDRLRSACRIRMGPHRPAGFGDRSAAYFLRPGNGPFRFHQALKPGGIVEDCRPMELFCIAPLPYYLGFGLYQRTGIYRFGSDRQFSFPEWQYVQSLFYHRKAFNFQLAQPHLYGPTIDLAFWGWALDAPVRNAHQYPLYDP